MHAGLVNPRAIVQLEGLVKLKKKKKKKIPWPRWDSNPQPSGL
jgi:hypothetical protein